jgi:hypothetical protein
VALLVVPPPDVEPWPSLGKQVCDFLEDRSVFGPGSFQGEPYRLSPEFRAAIYRAYEVYPAGHELAGRRRFKRVGISVRKGLAKTEWAAELVFAELHPEGPVRCDGFDAAGQPVGRPVVRPYIPMLSVTVEQVEELAFGTLLYICQECDDADLFDAGLERVIRLSPHGREDGRAVPLSQSPGAREGARTTMQLFDEPHRLYQPMHRAAHKTMDANLPKRPLEDPWALYVGTAGEPGQQSIAEDLHAEAEAIRDGLITDPRLFYFYRWADGVYDLDDKAERLTAIREATGPPGEFGPGQYEDIAEQWDRPTADPSYLERVWLNRWRRSRDQVFDAARLVELRVPEQLEAGAFVVGGFDGARFRDSTAIVLTEVPSGRQQLVALWERPADLHPDAGWEAPELEVFEAWAWVLDTFEVWRVYGDPPHWTESYAGWAGRWPDVFVEWWTNRHRAMAFAVKEYREGMSSGAVTHVHRPHPYDVAFERHLTAAARRVVNIFDDAGQQLFLMGKPPDGRKIDAAMAGCLSWQAYLEAVKSGAKPRPRTLAVPRRIR